ncbi:Ephrin type-A receptor 3 [Holothuria leucospilota]|uniref:Ephrin type-A receptor 3 n=1 Tax=Holothuria leucospilota TaxID=206669 RepID=A0A9Q1CDC1_HOLLE|nr:Ephrin type-A receptor 3 [Holothuria leucospilota]
MEVGATEPTVQTETHTFGEDVRFDCNTSHNGTQALWRRTTSNGYQLLYAGVSPVITREGTYIKVSQFKYSLFLNSISIEDEGLYDCIQFTKKLASYRLEILVSPEVRIQREGTNLSGTHFVDKGTELQLACIVFRTKEKPVIEWKIGNIPLTGGGEEMVNSSNRFIDGTFDFRIPLTYIIEHDTNIVCSSYSDYNKSVSVIISTARFPNKENSSNYAVLIVAFLLAFLIAISGGGWICLRVSDTEGTSQPSDMEGMDRNLEVTPTENLLLLQDYMTCESLAEYLSITTFGTEAEQEDMEMFVLKLTNISLQVCYGMQFAMTFGLSHPELSVKKILINEREICKLYDFCLAEDASKFLECLKSKSKFLPTNHPPECVARNEYTSSSDVWYTAFSIREIYFYGNKQIPSDNNLDHEKSEICSLHPNLCPPIVNERIKECMKSNQNDRPKIVTELVTVLKEFCSTSESNSSAQVDKKNRKCSPYVPMIDDSGEGMYSLPVK